MAVAAATQPKAASGKKRPAQKPKHKPEAGGGAARGKKRPAPTDADGKKSFVDQKLAKKQRKMQRPHYDMVTRAKQIWNVIRERDVDKQKRAALVDELFALVQGKIFEVAAKHDASRVVQSLMQFGSPAQRSQVVAELQAHVVELAKMQYGCFLVQKLLKYGSKRDRALLVKQLTGHVVALGTHNIAANVLEFAQEHLQPAQLSGLKLEFYGKEFAYFKAESKKNLADIVAASPEKRPAVMKSLGGALARMADKQLLGLAFVQTLLWEYMSVADYAEATAMIANVRDAALALLATRNGARVVSTCVALGSPKDRKRVIKSLKDKVLAAVNHPSGYLVVLRLLDVVDDTVLVQKSVLAELSGELLAVASHASGRKVLLQLLSPGNKAYLSPDDLALLAPPLVPSAADAAVLVPNYKKDPAARREELLKGLLPKLEAVCAAHAPAMLRSKEARDVLVEVLKRSSSRELQRAVVDAALAESEGEGEGEGEGGDEPVLPLHADAVGHFALRRVIKETPCAVPLLAAAADRLADWATSNRGSFVVLAFLESEHSAGEARTAVPKALAAVKDELRALAAAQKGTQLLLERL